MKRLFILTVLMFSATIVAAQEYDEAWENWVSTLERQYPLGKSSISWSENGQMVSYDFDNDGYFIEVWRSDARFRGVSWALKTGGYPPENYPDPYIAPPVGYNATQAVYKMMPWQYYPIVTGSYLMVSIYFDSTTGEVSDIVFKFDADESFALVPPQIFDQIDREMRRVLRVSPTPAGRQLNFLFGGANFYFGGDPYE